jgi:hypothetical protein
LQAIVQSAVIDVAVWQPDELFANYPEGARSKNAFFPPDPSPYDFIKSGRRYMFKKSNKRYVDQFWGEVVAYQVGTILGVQVPPAYAALNSDTGICAALIEWFYIDGEASLVSGGNYMQLIDPNYDRKFGAMHNFRWVNVISRAMKKWSTQNQDKFWAEAMLFDALIGNTDRHQENWGYLFVKSAQKDNIASLAPLFDNGTSLGHERFPHLLTKWQDSDYEEYIIKGTHHMKWDKGEEPRSQHFDMIRRIVGMFPSLKDGLNAMIVNFNIDEVAKNLETLKKLSLPVELSSERADLYLKLLSLRKRKLEAVLS